MDFIAFIHECRYVYFFEVCVKLFIRQQYPLAPKAPVLTQMCTRTEAWLALRKCNFYLTDTEYAYEYSSSGYICVFIYMCSCRVGVSVSQTIRQR